MIRQHLQRVAGVRSWRHVGEQLAYAPRMLKHPIDAVYELRFARKGSAVSATILLLLFYLAQVFSIGVTNFVFNPLGLSGTNPGRLALFVFAPFAVWVIANYLVSSIARGQGRFQDVYVSAAYALVPVILFAPPVAVFSNVLTLDEAAVHGSLVTGMWIWTGFLAFVHVMVTHEYDVGETVRVILWSIFTMAMMVLFVAALGIISAQSANFIIQVFREATLSV